MIRVLIYCMGNICRSPMAEAVMAQRIREAGLSHLIEVDSAGTGGWHAGETAHPRTLALLRQHSIPYDGRARQIRRQDLDEFDYVLAMDADNLSHAARWEGATRPQLFLSYANQAGTVREREVPDPYYTGEYERVYDLVTRGCDALLAAIRAEHGI